MALLIRWALGASLLILLVLGMNLLAVILRDRLQRQR